MIPTNKRKGRGSQVLFTEDASCNFVNQIMILPTKLFSECRYTEESYFRKAIKTSTSLFAAFIVRLALDRQSLQKTVPLSSHPP